MRESKGISLVELILAVAIIAILSAVTLPMGSRFIQKSHAKTTTETLVSYLNSSRIFSQSAKEGTTWGVYITQDRITLYSGTDYATRNTALDQEYNVPASVTLNPVPTEISFTKESGETTGGIITITEAEGNFQTLTIDTEGNVDVT